MLLWHALIQAYGYVDRLLNVSATLKSRTVLIPFTVHGKCYPRLTKYITVYENGE